MSEERTYTFNMPKSTDEIDIVEAIGTNEKRMYYLRMDLIEDFNRSVEVCERKIMIEMSEKDEYEKYQKFANVTILSYIT